MVFRLLCLYKTNLGFAHNLRCVQHGHECLLHGCWLCPALKRKQPLKNLKLFANLKIVKHIVNFQDHRGQFKRVVDFGMALQVSVDSITKLLLVLQNHAAKTFQQRSAVFQFSGLSGFEELALIFDQLNY